MSDEQKFPADRSDSDPLEDSTSGDHHEAPTLPPGKSKPASGDHHEAPTLPPGKSKPASDDHHEAPTLPPGKSKPASGDHHEAPTLPPGKSKPASGDHHEATTLPPGAKLPAGDPEETPESSAGPTLGNAPSIPESLGRYRIIKVLGQGGMGAVYLAEDAQLQRHVAIKVPFFEEADKEEMLDRFQREARALAAIQHPNICPVFEVAEEDGVHYMAMAFIEGKQLSKFVQRDKPLPIREVVKLVRKLALALDQAHKQGVIHHGHRIKRTIDYSQGACLSEG